MPSIERATFSLRARSQSRPRPDGHTTDDDQRPVHDHVDRPYFSTRFSWGRSSWPLALSIIGRVEKRLTNGAEDDVAHYYRHMKPILD